MTKQEEIRDKLRKVYKLWGFESAQCETLLDSTLACLHSQGVVIKVDMGIKDHPAFQTGSQAMMYGYITDQCHLVAVESLIEEGKCKS